MDWLFGGPVQQPTNLPAAHQVPSETLGGFRFHSLNSNAIVILGNNNNNGINKRFRLDRRASLAVAALLALVPYIRARRMHEIFLLYSATFIQCLTLKEERMMGGGGEGEGRK
jgi:hypothetical protein